MGYFGNYHSNFISIFCILAVMRKFLAFFFLSIILLNTAGYYIFFEGLKYRSSITWSFDEDDSNGQEVIVKIPMNVPYFSQERDWERGEGQFEYQGEIYRIVRHKLTLDAMYIGCVKDKEGNLIQQQLADFAKTFTDKEGDSKQSVKSFPGFIKEYLSNTVVVKPSVQGWSWTLVYAIPHQSLVPSFFASIVHPPERIG